MSYLGSVLEFFRRWDARPPAQEKLVTFWNRPRKYPIINWGDSGLRLPNYAILRWAASQVQLFFFFFPRQCAILIGLSHKNKLQTCDSPRYSSYYVAIELVCEVEVPPLCVRYVGEKRRTLGKEYRLKWGAIGSTVWEHIANLKNFLRDPLENLRTSLKTDGNRLGTWYKYKNLKIPSPHHTTFYFGKWLCLTEYIQTIEQSSCWRR
jgi:hypothetical protein